MKFKARVLKGSGKLPADGKLEDRPSSDWIAYFASIEHMLRGRKVGRQLAARMKNTYYHFISVTVNQAVAFSIRLYGQIVLELYISATPMVQMPGYHDAGFSFTAPFAFTACTGIETGPPGESAHLAVRISTPVSVTRRVCSACGQEF